MSSENKQMVLQYWLDFKRKFLVALVLFVVMTLSGATAITEGISERFVLPCVILLSLALPIAALSLISFKSRTPYFSFNHDAFKGGATFGVLFATSLSFVVGVIVTAAATAAAGVPLRVSPQISLARLYWPGQPAEIDEAAAALLLAQANQKKNERAWREATEKYTAYLLKAPNDSSAIFDLGTCYKELGDQEKALQSYSLAFSIEKRKTESLRPILYRLYYAQKSVSEMLQSGYRHADRYGEVGGKSL